MCKLSFSWVWINLSSCASLIGLSQSSKLSDIAESWQFANICSPYILSISYRSRGNGVLSFKNRLSRIVIGSATLSPLLMKVWFKSSSFSYFWRLGHILELFYSGGNRRLIPFLRFWARCFFYHLTCLYELLNPLWFLFLWWLQNMFYVSICIPELVGFLSCVFLLLYYVLVYAPFLEHLAQAVSLLPCLISWSWWWFCSLSLGILELSSKVLRFSYFNGWQLFEIKG